MMNQERSDDVTQPLASNGKAHVEHPKVSFLQKRIQYCPAPGRDKSICFISWLLVKPVFFRELDDAEEAEKRSHVLNYARAVSRTFLAWYRCLTPVEWNGTTCALSTRKQNIKKKRLI